MTMTMKLLHFRLLVVSKNFGAFRLLQTYSPLRQYHSMQVFVDELKPFLLV